MRLNGTAHCQNALLAVMFKYRPVLPIVCVVFFKAGSRHAEVAPRDASLGSMASNTSQGTTQNLVLASNVGDYATRSLIVACGSCRSLRTIPLAELPAEPTIMQAMMRMHCRSCRGRVEAALLDNNVKGWRARVMKILGLAGRRTSGSVWCAPEHVRRTCDGPMATPSSGDLSSEPPHTS
jgi:hypothetical protein